MKIRYDLHIHSCLSPCGDADMTPNNIVNMALLAGLELIALTDHNSCKNCPAFLRAAERAGLVAVPGMELCTAEECHIICLFPALDAAMAFDRFIEAALPPVENRPDIFGEQWILDEEDALTGSFPLLLTTASSLSVDEVVGTVRGYGGAAFPAHIDRPSYSVTAALGDIPPVGFRAIEVTAAGDVAALAARYPEMRGKPVIWNSDAHYLEQIQEAGPWLDLPENTPAALIAALNGDLPAAWGRGE